MTERIAFRMNLFPGQAAEYKRRHDEIWPELSRVLKDVGILDYTIWLDHETHHLFATVELREGHSMANLPENEVCRRWWAFMADIMETHPDNAPVQIPLRKVYELT